mgnify:CR=1 FL=1
MLEEKFWLVQKFLTILSREQKLKIVSFYMLSKTNILIDILISSYVENILTTKMKGHGHF